MDQIPNTNTSMYSSKKTSPKRNTTQAHPYCTKPKTQVNTVIQDFPLKDDVAPGFGTGLLIIMLIECQVALVPEWSCISWN